MFVLFEMISLLFLVAFVKLVQSGTLNNYADDRRFCHIALTMAKPCQFPELFLKEEGTVHKIASTMRIQARQLGPGFKRLLMISEERYIKYLKRMKVLMLSRRNMGKFVEDLSEKNVRDYLPSTTEVDVFQYQPVVGLLRTVSVSLESIDDLRLEYHKNAIAALNTYSSIHYDYNAYARLPNMRKRWSTEQLENFIGKAFVNFDFGATFPDLIMCLSLLQYRQYVALLDGDLDHVRTISDLYSRVLDALENMIFAPVSTLSYMTPKGPVRVQIMPQAIKGPKSVPICTLPYENETIVQISILDVKYPEDSDYVLSQLIHLDLFAAITD